MRRARDGLEQERRDGLPAHAADPRRGERRGERGLELLARHGIGRRYGEDDALMSRERPPVQREHARRGRVVHPVLERDAARVG
jgi:hypothetical protein